jgi:hypothetical protein
MAERSRIVNSQPNTRKLGLLPSRPHDLKRRLVLAKYVADLPDPPDECDWTGSISDWLMLMNDQLGCCGPAAWFHGCMSKVACSQSTIIQPTDQELVAFYSTVGGYRPGRPWTDGGVNNADMLSIAQKQGFTIGGVHRTIGPYAGVDAADVATIKKAIYYLHGCLIGIQLPRYWYDNFGKGKVWDKTNSPIEGGHDIWGYKYDRDGVYIVTWGDGETLMTWAGAEQNADDITAIAEKDAEINPATGRTAQGILLQDWKQEVQILTGQAA